jgi:hypothetical protein
VELGLTPIGKEHLITLKKVFIKKEELLLEEILQLLVTYTMLTKIISMDQNHIIHGFGMLKNLVGFHQQVIQQYTLIPMGKIKNIIT